MDLIVEVGTVNDIDELEQLYNDLNDYLAEGINYPGWIKGIYPIREDAANGIKENALYVARCNGRIAGSIILRHKPEEAYYKVKWSFESDYSDVFVIYTFAVHPNFLKCGVGKALMDFATKHAIMNNAKALRLDVYEKNMPAIKLYEKCGFKYVDTVDLGYGEHGLDWFELYEKQLVR